MSSDSSVDFQEVLRRALKYVIEGGSVAVCVYLLNKGRFKFEEIAIIALTAAAVFAILDMFSPSISYAARQGTGFGLGAQMVGFPNLGSAGPAAV